MHFTDSLAYINLMQKGYEEVLYVGCLISLVKLNHVASLRHNYYKFP